MLASVLQAASVDLGSTHERTGKEGVQGACVLVVALPPRFFLSQRTAAATAAVATIQHSGESRLLPAAESCTCASFWCCCGGRAERITGFCLRNGLKVKLKLAVTARSWHLAASLNSNITRLGRPRRAASADALAKRPKSAPVSTGDLPVINR